MSTSLFNVSIVHLQLQPFQQAWGDFIYCWQFSQCYIFFHRLTIKTQEYCWEFVTHYLPGIERLFLFTTFFGTSIASPLFLSFSSLASLKALICSFNFSLSAWITDMLQIRTWINIRVVPKDRSNLSKMKLYFTNRKYSILLKPTLI